MKIHIYIFRETEKEREKDNLKHNLDDETMKEIKVG